MTSRFPISKTLWVAIAVVAVAVVLNILATVVPLRWDLTDDKHFSLSAPTKHLLGELDESVEVDVLLRGPLNSGFVRLKKATGDILEEMNVVAGEGICVHYPDTATYGLEPIVIHERTTQGQTSQTMVYPYAVVRYKGHGVKVELLRNNRGLSGEENLNLSIENLEFAFVEALRVLTQDKTEKVVFLEGHNELPERYVYDFTSALARFYQVDRGALANVSGVLDDYKAVVIADPQEPFSDADKYIIDQYVMQGGRVLWLVNGVRFSDAGLSSGGMTPIIALDLHLNDLFFRYGVRVNPVLVQDWQCMLVPVDVSVDGKQPNWQPMPWTYAPLLLTSQVSPITRHLMQVSATFASVVEPVGEVDGIRKEVLLATSTHSRVTPCPAQVDLNWASDKAEDFPCAYVPVAMGLEGAFTSLYAHQLPPEEVEQKAAFIKQGKRTKQVVVAAGSVARNEWQQGQPLPLGFDRYTGVQYGNRDFLTNAVLWLTDDNGWMQLRQKEVALRLINNRRAQDTLATARIISIALPLALLLLTAGAVWGIRKRKYVI